MGHATSNRLQFPRLPGRKGSKQTTNMGCSYDDDPRLPLRRLRRGAAAHGARGGTAQGLEPLVPLLTYATRRGRLIIDDATGFIPSRKLLRRRRAVISRQAHPVEITQL